MTEQWMTEDQRYCYRMLCDCFGEHNLKSIKPCGTGIRTTMHSLSTFDNNRLTELVFLAHDRCVRVELANGGPWMTGLKLHRRHTRNGERMQAHPTIEEALCNHRILYSAPTLDHFADVNKMVGQEDQP